MAVYCSSPSLLLWYQRVYIIPFLKLNARLRALFFCLYSSFSFPSPAWAAVSTDVLSLSIALVWYKTHNGDDYKLNLINSQKHIQPNASCYLKVFARKQKKHIHMRKCTLCISLGGSRHIITKRMRTLNLETTKHAKQVMRGSWRERVCEKLSKPNVV